MNKVTILTHTRSDDNGSATLTLQVKRNNTFGLRSVFENLVDLMEEEEEEPGIRLKRQHRYTAALSNNTRQTDQIDMPVTLVNMTGAPDLSAGIPKSLEYLSIAKNDRDAIKLARLVKLSKHANPHGYETSKNNIKAWALIRATGRMEISSKELFDLFQKNDIPLMNGRNSVNSYFRSFYKYGWATPSTVKSKHRHIILNDSAVSRIDQIFHDYYRCNLTDSVGILAN
jgi:hypothetical protein